MKTLGVRRPSRRAPWQLSRQFTDEEEDANIGHVDSSATESLLKQFHHDQLFIYPRSRCLGSVERESYDSRVSVL